MVIAVSHDRHFLNTVCTPHRGHRLRQNQDVAALTTSGTSPPRWCAGAAQQEQAQSGKDRRIAAVHPALLRQQGYMQAAYRPPQALRCFDREEMPCSTRRYPFCGLPARASWARTFSPSRTVRHRDGVEAAGQSVFSVNWGQDRLRGRKRAGADRPVQDPHGRAGAGRGSGQVGGVSTIRSYLPKDTPYFDGNQMELRTGCASIPPRRTTCTSGASFDVGSATTCSSP